MHAPDRRARHRQRRGIVLVLVLALLALMAVIGVTFATFSGQARVGAMQFAESRVAPQPEDLFDFALSQLINDTNNPVSALRGHSLLRDMYGNDSVARGTSARFGNRLLKLPAFQAPVLNANLSNAPLRLLDVRLLTAGPRAGFYEYRTNIPITDATTGLDFTGWVLRLTGSNPGPVPAVAQTFEVLNDDFTGTDAFSVETVGGTNVSMHLLTLSPTDDATVLNNVTTGTSVPLVQPHTFPGGTLTVNTTLATFTLDGRFLRAFNGSGVAASGVRNRNLNVDTDPLRPPNAISAEPNFLFNGAGNPGNVAGAGFTLGIPDNIPADETYDACDLENWFLAIQSADGRVVVPSFHRPGVIRTWVDGAGNVVDDWSNTNTANAANPYTIDSRARILRPRRVDMGPGFPDDPRPDPATGLIAYDVDNDGDGVTDAVWLDLGYPPQRDSSGKLYKPLFAITVLGLNGRLPLNTAGNLQGRGYVTSDLTDSNSDGFADVFPPYDVGDPTFDHTSHIGASPNEVNPQYAFLAPEVVNGSPIPNFHVDQLRRLLTGDFEFSDSGSPVAGRWGEPGLLDLDNATRPGFPGYRILAGISMPLVASADGFLAADGRRDSDHDANDFYNLAASGNAPPLRWEYSDMPDTAGALVFPVERIRRFLTPTDPLGTGRLMGFNRPYPDQGVVAGTSDIAAGVTGRYDYGTGFDGRGRTSYFHHYRPAGLPPNDGDPALAPDYSTVDSVRALTPNLLHGYEAQRNPIYRDSDPDSATANWNRIHVAGMPYNTATPKAAPTYDVAINSPQILNAPGQYYNRGYDFDGDFIPDYAYRSGGLNWGEADALNLYNPGQYDAPFGPSDLEWLYRNQDIDGTSLDSRLARLGPFYADASGTSKRYFDPSTPQHNRLFSVDVWSTNGFAWAPDNPGGITFPNNSRFPNAASSASFAATGGVTPRIAQRDRKINLNFPLPVSADPREPVRIKWINEAYRFAKAVLPPKSVDHPEELARLGQYIVNIIDFRDTDDVMTIWNNPDVEMDWDPADATVAPVAVFTSTAVDTGHERYPLVHYGMEFQPVAINETMAYWFKRKEGTAEKETGRFFLELVNLLNSDDGGGYDADGDPIRGESSDLTLSNWDIVVTREATEQTGFQRPDPITGQLPPAPETPPSGWWRRFAHLTNDDGEMIDHEGEVSTIRGLRENGDPEHFVVGHVAPTGPGGVPIELSADDEGDVERDMPDPDAVLRKAWDGIEDRDGSGEVDLDDYNFERDMPGDLDSGTEELELLLPVAGLDPTTDQSYYWVYLRRPASPRLPVDDQPFIDGDPNDPNPNYNPMVVVDSMRFPYLLNDDPTIVPGTPDRVDVDEANQEIWSVQRLQPYRGGQAVPNVDTSATYEPVTAYGYSNQVENGDDNDAVYGLWDPALGDLRLGNGPPINRATKRLENTLGDNNEPDSEAWDGFVFLDRDFQSVAELTLVPVTPPGLFTKHFVEHNPDPGNENLPVNWIDTSDPADRFVVWPLKPDGTPPPATPPVLDPTGVVTPAPLYSYIDPPTVKPPAFSTVVGQELDDNAVVPHAYPYLANDFFFSADGQSTADNPPPTGTGPVAGGSTGAGWHKLLAFFEVPTSSYGAIGPVADGHNFDWLRQDTRPGQINLNLIIDEPVFFGLLDDPRLNYKAVTGAIPNDVIPSVVTQVDVTGIPTTTPPGSYGMNNTGFFYVDETITPLPPPITAMKAAFRNFLAARHWNTQSVDALKGFLFGAGPESPFHDLSYPDINFTLMRPADNVFDTTIPLDPTNPNLDPGYGVRPTPPADSLKPPIIPPRRLFELPSKFHTLGLGAEVNLFEAPVAPWLNARGEPRYYLGSNRYVGLNNADGGSDDGPPDRRQHPLYRSEMLQKVMNLSTVRTHQYAVWITVGYFEVLKPGNPLMASTNPAAAVDVLGAELGEAGGRSRRQRLFCIIDRTRATGFDPGNPGDFRDVIVYRRRIE